MATLWIIPTPIGNLEDITLRALGVLRDTAALACEDTRHTRKLLKAHEIPVPPVVFSCHEHNEVRAVKRILRLLESGKDVSLCTDGGMPAVSDPGYRVISVVAETDHTVVVLPGPTAVETALVASGLPTSSYTFKGFPPRKAGKLKTFLEAEQDSPHTLVFYESPYRVGKFLTAAVEVLGDRKTAVCVELTKKFERIHRGFLTDLAADFTVTRPKGEVTIIIAPPHPKFTR